ncbi:Repetitive proline-rich cell wall protein repeat [Trypanosoma melophagium]|uniref:Repetitive proline-rich cell wall protein repeat n=1 Tax=Trypanosoma melophagium TaxID=715481 RepID=UPI00351A3BAA|nr:Repetitive proline-rich cell wall protein repeat [Trypanosoma melophagium]
MDLDAFLNKKSKKLAGSKKKAKTGELSEKERAELGLDVFGGLDTAGAEPLPIPLTEPNNNTIGGGSSDVNNEKNKRSDDVNKNTTAGSPEAVVVPVNLPAKEEDPNGNPTPTPTPTSPPPPTTTTTIMEKTEEAGVPNVFVRVVNTSERKVKGWDAVRSPTGGSVEDLLAKAAEKTGPQKFVARGNDGATGTIASTRGRLNARAELPTLEEVAAGVPQKNEEAEAEAEKPATSGAYKPPTDKPSSGAYKPPTDKPSAGVYKPPTEQAPKVAEESTNDKPSTGVYRPPTERASAGAYKPPTDRPSAGVYKPPTDKPSSGAYKPPTDKPSLGAYKPPTDKPSAGVYKPPTDKPSSGAYKPPTDKPSSGAYKPPTDKPSSGAYKPPTDRPSARVYRPPNRTSAPPPS